MKVEVLDEPELEFGGGARHIDIRFGLMHSGPLDVLDPRLRAISVGMVGTPDTIEGLSRWFDRCRDEIAAKESPYPNLFPLFPGFRPDTAFQSTLLIENETQRTVRERDLASLTKAPGSTDLIEAAVDLFVDELRYVAEKERPDVLVCAPPMDFWAAVKGDSAGQHAFDAEHTDSQTLLAADSRYEFHDLLKARAMALRIPLQLIWPHTYDSSKRRRQKRRPDSARGQQDEATRAWNLHTALYYKAGGLPWRLVRDQSQLTACCVGISFYYSLDGDRLLTSTAQIFNERGDGVVVRGGQATISKEDRQPHLDEAGADALITEALGTYRREHKTLPARIVLHKTSKYSPAERVGFQTGAERAGIEVIDLLSLDSSSIRLMRQGTHPPLRGTLLSLDDQTHVLYTRGSVDFFQVYPGLYVPLPLLFRAENAEQTPLFLANELLALTKMNWNSTQFDGHDPITTRGARQVGAILRYLGDSAPPEPAYSYYM